MPDQTSDPGAITRNDLKTPTVKDVYDEVILLRNERKNHDDKRDVLDKARDDLAARRHTSLVGQLQEHAGVLKVHGSQIGMLQQGGTASRPLWAAVALLTLIFLALAYYDLRLAMVS